MPLPGQININMEIRRHKFGWTGHTLCKDDTALQGSSAIKSTRYKRKAKKFMATHYTE
jgi:hypothetical protein